MVFYRQILSTGNLIITQGMIMIHSEITFYPRPPAAIDYQRLFETTGWNQQYRASREELY